MKMWDIDLKVSTYLHQKEYDQAENLLLEQYPEVKARGNATEIRHILNGLATFYSLPFKKNLSRAESYFREMEAVLPSCETDLRIASFYFYSLRDFAKTVERVQAMDAYERQEKKDIQFYYSALTLKGQALLYLNRTEEAAAALRELERIIATSPKQVPYGDEFNFLDQMTQQKLELKLCKQLAAVIVDRVRDPEFRNKFLDLQKQLES